MNRKNKILIFVFAILIPLFHESAHWLGYYIDGISATFKYGITYTYGGKKGFYGVLFGPLLNFFLSVIAFFISYIDKQNRTYWYIISLTSSISRFFNCVLILFMSLFNKNVILLNDEGKISELFRLPSYSLYIVSIIVYILLFAIICIHIEDNKLFKEITFRIFIYTFFISLIIICYQFLLA
ncbi:Uncharacterised protein [Clostridium putrefaciens]|uniref:Uncharacterized protein n=1 Tax=Clostridium putrefaciens TaxID=99675 RepID=A0A381J7B9_9CLOT|nr:hypothetical protein [Clostridium putrefaciens]SUY46883.1 Uncharacterised protein [Clostridium putrefaciens]